MGEARHDRSGRAGRDKGGARRPGEKVRLPFDDDAMLSTVRSKAILSAADDQITGESIRHQLLRSRM